MPFFFFRFFPRIFEATNYFVFCDSHESAWIPMFHSCAEHLCAKHTLSFISVIVSAYSISFPLSDNYVVLWMYLISGPMNLLSHYSVCAFDNVFSLYLSLFNPLNCLLEKFTVCQKWSYFNAKPTSHKLILSLCTYLNLVTACTVSISLLVSASMTDVQWNVQVASGWFCSAVSLPCNLKAHHAVMRFTNTNHHWIILPRWTSTSVTCIL